MTEYMANQQIGKKHQKILEELTRSYLPALEEDKSWFRKVQDRVERLVQECYQLPSRGEDAVQRGSQAERFFAAKVDEVAGKEVAVHVKGLKDKLSPEFCLHHRAIVSGGRYEKAEYLEIRKLTELPPRATPYLDQLPLFQDELHQLPKDYQGLIDQGPLA